MTRNQELALFARLDALSKPLHSNYWHIDAQQGTIKEGYSNLPASAKVLRITARVPTGKTVEIADFAYTGTSATDVLIFDAPAGSYFPQNMGIEKSDNTVVVSLFYTV